MDRLVTRPTLPAHLARLGIVGVVGASDRSAAVFTGLGDQVPASNEDVRVGATVGLQALFVGQVGV
jgi:hypothetical protein